MVMHHTPAYAIAPAVLEDAYSCVAHTNHLASWCEDRLQGAFRCERRRALRGAEVVAPRAAGDAEGFGQLLLDLGALALLPSVEQCMAVFQSVPPSM